MNALLVFLILMVCVGAVSADEIVQSSDAALNAASDDVAVDAVSDTQNNLENGHELISDYLAIYSSEDDLGEGETGSFSEIQEEIDSGSNEIDLQKNYKFNEGTDSKDGISINGYGREVTINANNHILDGGNLARIFKVGGIKSFTLNDAIIINGFADDFGGAISTATNYNQPKIIINNCTFENNSANYRGGAILAKDLEIKDSKFINNSAPSGGALSNDDDTIGLQTVYDIINTTFEDNKAEVAGGAIQMKTTNQESLNIEGSSFNNNYGGSYGGGAIIAPNVNVGNSNFTNNAAFNYAGAISTDYLIVKNCKFENNSAKHAGAFFARLFSIDDSQFEGNEADDGKIIATYYYWDSGTELPEILEYDYDDLVDLEDLEEDIFYRRLICIEYNLDNYDSEVNGGSYAFYTTDTSYLINYVDNSEIIEQVKILYYLCNLDEDMLDGSFRNWYGQMQLSGVVGRLCEEDLSNPKDEVVQQIMELYNSGFRVPDNQYLLPNGTLVKYEFYFYINPEYIQNYMGYDQTTEDGYNETVSKETLNRTVEIGEEVQFRITVTNNGEQILKGVFVNDSDFDEGLIYQSYINETGDWIFNESSKIWTLNTDLEVGKSASFIVIFKTAKVGELVNNVTAGFENILVANSTNTTNVTNVSTTNVTNDTNITNTTNTTNNTDVPSEDVPDEDVPDEDHIHEVNLDKKVHISKSATGNPLFVLALAILALALVPRRKH